MKKIILVGCGGSGKSTLARQLGDKLKLPVIHLDKYFWRPGWIETPRDEWRAKVTDLCKADSWIMDGNFGGSADIRFKNADTVIFLDIPRSKCLFRWLKRYFKFRHGGRPDMTEGCIEKIDLEYLRWVWNFQKDSRPKISQLIETHASHAKVFILKSDAEVREFLDSVVI